MLGGCWSSRSFLTFRFLRFKKAFRFAFLLLFLFMSSSIIMCGVVSMTLRCWTGGACVFVASSRPRFIRALYCGNVSPGLTWIHSCSEVRAGFLSSCLCFLEMRCGESRMTWNFLGSRSSKSGMKCEGSNGSAASIPASFFWRKIKMLPG